MWKRIGTAAAGAILIALIPAPGRADPVSLDQAIRDSHPVYYYPLTDPAGSTEAADVSARQWPALTTTPVNAQGATGAPLVFTGSDVAFGGLDYLGGGPAPRMKGRKFHTQRAFSIMAWWEQPSDNGMTQTLLRAQNREISIGGGDLFVQPSRCATEAVPVAKVPSNGEHEVVLTELGQHITVYLDGAEAFTLKMCGFHRSPLSVGSFPGLVGFNAYQGSGSYVTGWKRVLTSDEVAALWTAGTS